MLQGGLDAVTINHHERVNDAVHAPRVSLQARDESGTSLEISCRVPIKPRRAAVLSNTRIQPHLRAGTEKAVVLLSKPTMIEYWLFLSHCCSPSFATFQEAQNCPLVRPALSGGRLFPEELSMTFKNGRMPSQPVGHFWPALLAMNSAAPTKGRLW